MRKDGDFGEQVGIYHQTLSQSVLENLDEAFHWELREEGEQGGRKGPMFEEDVSVHRNPASRA